jgi:transcription initiation factor TFIID subunit TAF12
MRKGCHLAGLVQVHQQVEAVQQQALAQQAAAHQRQQRHLGLHKERASGCWLPPAAPPTPARQLAVRPLLTRDVAGLVPAASAVRMPAP